MNGGRRNLNNIFTNEGNDHSVVAGELATFGLHTTPLLANLSGNTVPTSDELDLCRGEFGQPRASPPFLGAQIGDPVRHGFGVAAIIGEDRMSPEADLGKRTKPGHATAALPCYPRGCGRGGGHSPRTASPRPPSPGLLDTSSAPPRCS